MQPSLQPRDLHIPPARSQTSAFTQGVCRLGCEGPTSCPMSWELSGYNWDSLGLTAPVSHLRDCCPSLPNVQGLTRIYFAHFWSKTPHILTVFWLLGRVNVAPLPHLGWKEKWQLSFHFSGLCILLSTPSRFGVNAQLVRVFVPVLQPGICQSGRMITLSSQGGGDCGGLSPPLLCPGASGHCGCPRESPCPPRWGHQLSPCCSGGPSLDGSVCGKCMN